MCHIFPRKISTASTIDLIMILLIVWLVITEECHTSLFLNSFNHVICKLPAILHYILSLVQVLCFIFLKETLNLQIFLIISYLDSFSFTLHSMDSDILFWISVLWLFFIWHLQEQIVYIELLVWSPLMKYIAHQNWTDYIFF